MKPLLRVASIPSPDEEQNPYLHLFYQGLPKHGVELVGGARFKEEWLQANIDKVDVLHFHWPEELYSRPSGAEFRWALRAFLRRLRLARRLGYKIVWTVHELLPNDRKYFWYEYLSRLLFARYCNGVIVHFPSAVRDVRRLFFRRLPIEVIPHGNYCSWYPNNISREEARSDLGIDQKSFVFLVFGMVKRYKGLEAVIQSFQRIFQPDGGNELLLIAGRDVEGIEGDIQSVIAGFPKIRRHAAYIPDDQVAAFFNAADAVVLPYQKIYTSGVALLALSFGKPVIAPRRGGLPELINSSSGLLFDNGGRQSLDMALKQARQWDSRDLAKTITAEAGKYDWELIWPKAAKFYRELVH